MKMAHCEAAKAKSFVGMIPMHALDKKEATKIKEFFTEPSSS